MEIDYDAPAFSNDILLVEVRFGFVFCLRVNHSSSVHQISVQPGFDDFVLDDFVDDHGVVGKAFSLVTVPEKEAGRFVEVDFREKLRKERLPDSLLVAFIVHHATHAFFSAR